jgi:tRNA(Ile)-lysidine synthase
VPPLATRVGRTIRHHALLVPADRVAVAISGGPDSVALVWLLRDVALTAGFSLAGLIHVNHGLRGAESAGDEAFCRALAARLDLPIEVQHLDTAALARAAGRSIEATARDARYAFFEVAAPRLDATAVATGHTLDDQAETVLLRLLRGAGIRGAAGIRIRRGPYVRPLLECRRTDVRRYLVARGERFREDSSNADRSIPRNRIRHDLVPAIEAIAPGGVRALARFAALAADDDAFLEHTAIEVAPSIVLSDEGRLELDADRLASAPAPLARRVVRRLVEAVSGRPLGAGHTDALVDLARADTLTGHLDLPGLAVERQGRLLAVAVVTGGGAGRRLAETVGFERPLPVPGRVEVPEAGVAITATLESGRAAPPGAGSGDEAVVQARAVTLPLVVRSRRAGDRLRPLGAPGRRKLQDVLVDRKVPRAARDRVPIVVDAAGRIVWVAGLVLADRCRVTAPTAGVVVLTLKRLDSVSRTARTGTPGQPVPGAAPGVPARRERE